ncbi:MAG: alpha-glucosidase [Cyclobacteriaceae bacterium]
MTRHFKDAMVWWKHGVIYHVYTKSFYDSNGDGIGDLQGIIQKLDYIASLGVDAIWLSPIYESPMQDSGYDVSDYKSINSVFGTISDFKELLFECHARDIRVIMDMIMNHTSIEHPWFKKSRSSKHHPKRNWYIWKEGKNGGPPNNWKSVFGGSSWQYDETTGQYYLHSFLKEQPDLNWRNKQLRNAFFKEIKYWLDLGVDGFRLDAINMIGKDKRFRNNPGILGLLNLGNKLLNRNAPRSHKIVRKLRELIDSYDDKMIVGEIFAPPPGNATVAASYLGDGKNQLHMAFDFTLIFKRWSASHYYSAIENWYKQIPKKGWPSFVFSNHDLFRSKNRLGVGKDKEEKTKIMAVLLLTLRGTPFLYYGEELGMENIKLSKKHIVDPLGKKYWPLFAGRDIARSPMQWTDERYAGFSTSEPWLPVHKNFEDINLKTLEADQDSILNLYKKLIALRKEYPSLSMGDWKPIIKGENGLISYYRIYQNRKIQIILNFTSQKKKYQNGKEVFWKILLSSKRSTYEEVDSKNFEILPYEGVILKLL